MITLEKRSVRDMVLPKIKSYFVFGQELICPFKGQFGIKYSMVNCGLLNNLFVLVGSYVVDITENLSKNELIGNVKIYFVIPEGKTIGDDRMGR